MVASVLYGVAERDPLTYISEAGFLFVLAAAYTIEPVLRFLRMDSSQTVRQ